MTAPIAFDNSYARLPARFHARLAPTPVERPRLIQLNRALARDLGLDADWLASPDGVAALAGNRLPEGAEPLAAAYAGHQFGNFVPQLGDGRAILLGEVIGRDGRRDIQLKGSGPTPFSRHADGRAALGPVLREYLVSEAMAALGIPTTRALAAVSTGEHVARETFLPGAVLTRVASSHIRVGTFQFFSARGDVEGLRTLADHVLARHDPEAAQAENPYSALLAGVVARQAELVARWLLVGFVHGVMNTDNMSVAGETIDYGPCAFLDVYDPRTAFSSIDQHGRYAYGNQPRIALWNLARLAEALLPLLAADEGEAVAEAERVLEGFGPRFEAAYHGGLGRKIGLADLREDDAALAGDLLKRMAENQADFTLTFRNLCAAAARPEADGTVRDLFVDPTAYDDWAARWRQRLGQEQRDGAETARAMRAVNPAFIPRNHQVEAMIAAAVERDDFAPFERMLAVLAHPYDDQPDAAAYAEPPADRGVGYRTFCGT
ncbi:protein adenylyltransferase SelO [Methylobacterium symbioticum]|uniref:Protein nucleotidyltransferase YdiU n=1 Tax=Methylobacterium symbioticum TaxID=2584084 RepID=A0A509E8U3_9HYPH|nr:YdiU family protein [Methylobacterium symbioticum]VUD70518.1 hypothetical protein MET9862_01087 [Methylobacterium symbioticum]